jgi:hypothetical protein
MSQLTVEFPTSPWGDDDRVALRWERIADADAKPVDGDDGKGHLVRGALLALDVRPGYHVVEASWRNGRLTRHQTYIDPDERAVITIHPGIIKGSADKSGSTVDGIGHAVVRSPNGPESWRYLEYMNRTRCDIDESAEGLLGSRVSDQNFMQTDDTGRSWVAYRNGNDILLASLPFMAGSDHGASAVLRARPAGLPNLGLFGGDDAVMSDLLLSGNSLAEQCFAAATLAVSGSLPTMALRERPLPFCAYVFPALDTNGDARLSALETADIDPRWPPDLLIVLGWSKLFISRNGERIGESLHLLRIAVEAGVPFYSRSVRLLHEALSVLSQMTKVDEELVSLASRMAHRTIPTETFTTVRVF